MSTPETEKRRPISIWKRLLVTIALFVLAMLAVGFVVSRYQQNRIRRELDAIIAELDETDPGWRLEDLDAARPNPPPGENSAVVMEDALRILSHLVYSPTILQIEISIPAIPLPHLMREDERLPLEKVFAELAPALTRMRRISDLPEGRRQLDYAPDIGTIWMHVPAEATQVVSMLRLDTWHLAQQGKTDTALRSCRAALNIAWMLGNEPTLPAQFEQTDCALTASELIERTLAWGEPSEEVLAELARSLAGLEKHPTGVTAWCSLRAILHRWFQGLANGSIPKEEIDTLLESIGERPPLKSLARDWRLRYFGWSRSRIEMEHLRILSFLNRFVAVARLPLHEQEAAEKRLAAEVDSLPEGSLARWLLQFPCGKSIFLCRHSSQIRCMQVLIALERHRLATGNWPALLEDIAPDLLPVLPLDPFDGKPLRYLRRPDGVSVYSIGDNGVDDGGKLGTDAPDLGFRLWDVKARRQPPRAPEALQGLGSP